MKLLKKYHLPPKQTEWLNNFILFSMIFIVSAVFFYQFFILISYGVDVPIDDDWGDLIQHRTGSFSLKSLFFPTNDSLCVPGRLLDSISTYLFSGNSIIFQGVSYLLVLGSLVYFQFALLHEFAVNKLVLALGVLTISFMLQAGSYWGVQAGAYNQALPILCVLIILLLITKRSINNITINTLLISIIGTLCGLSYISGAIAMLVLTCWTLLMMKAAPNSLNKHYKSSAIGLGLATLITLPLQLWVILVYQTGHVHTLVPVALPIKWALPFKMPFWAFFLGMFSRSVGFWNDYTPYAWLVSSTILILIFCCSFYLLYNFLICRDIKAREDKFKLLYAFGALLIVIFAYAIIVSSGRANLRPSDISSFSDIFTLAQLRFHFFWFTLLFPWIAIIVGNYLSNRYKGIFLNLSILSLIFIISLHLIHVSNILDFQKYYSTAGNRKLNTLSCIYDKEQRGEKITCPDTFWGADITEGIAYARQLGLSFALRIPVKDTNKDTFALKPSLRIETGKSISLVFPKSIIGNQDKIKRIGIMFATWRRIHKGEAILTLHSKNSNFSRVFDLSTLKDNEYKYFNLDPDFYNSGELSSTTGNGVSVWESYKDNIAQSSCLVIEYSNGFNVSSPGCPKGLNSNKNWIIEFFATIFALFFVFFVTPYRAKNKH